MGNLPPLDNVAPPPQGPASMQLAIPFPEIAPEIVSIEIGGATFALRWYALAYIAGILFGWWLAARTLRAPRLWPGETPPMTPAQLEGLMTWIILGIILGGRLGFVLFYQPGYFLANPGQILAVWQGGMSFHGGLIGVLVAGGIFVARHRLPLLGSLDVMAIGTPPGLLLGRIANFINAELWGRPTDLPWGVIFPGAAAQDCAVLPCARHPSQLYEAGLEGLLLGGLILFVVWRRGWLRHPGRVAGLFALGYGLARFAVEFVRQADAQFITAGNPLGHVVQIGHAGLSMGQLLSLPLVLGGAALLWRARR